MNKTEKNAVFILFFLEKKCIRKEKTFMVGVYLKLSYIKIMFLCVTRWNQQWLQKFVVWLFRDGVSGYVSKQIKLG